MCVINNNSLKIHCIQNFCKRFKSKYFIWIFYTIHSRIWNIRHFQEKIAAFIKISNTLESEKFTHRVKQPSYSYLLIIFNFRIKSKKWSSIRKIFHFYLNVIYFNQRFFPHIRRQKPARILATLTRSSSPHLHLLYKKIIQLIKAVITFTGNKSNILSRVRYIFRALSSANVVFDNSFRIINSILLCEGVYTKVLLIQDLSSINRLYQKLDYFTKICCDLSTFIADF